MSIDPSSCGGWMAETKALGQLRPSPLKDSHKDQNLMVLENDDQVLSVMLVEVTKMSTSPG